MKELYNTYFENFQKVLAVAYKYKLPIDKIKQAISEITDFKITVPLIGGFSTGKSSILNTLIDKELLSTGIMPETAVPTELFYGQDNVIYCTDNGETEGNIIDLHTSTLKNNNIKLVKVTLNNEFLEQIPTIKLVDLPGFDSGCEIHNKAIDEYLPRSLAYLIVVSADEGTVRESVLNFLNELKLNDMDVCIVITKSDKIIPEELDEVVTHVREIIEQKMHLQNLKIAVTSADMNEVEELKEILLELQKNSDYIFQRTFSQKICTQLINVHSYLVKRLSRKNLDEQQLLHEKDLLETQIVDLQKNIEDEKKKFEKQTENCIISIQQKVESDLRSNSETLKNLLIQGQSIQEKVNFIVRNAVTIEINKQLEPKIRRYVEDISNLMQSTAFQTNVNSPILDQSIIEENEQMRSMLQSIVAPTTTIIGSVITSSLGTAVATALGITSTVLGPLGLIIGGIAGAFFGSAINKGMREKEENQKRKIAEQRVNEVISEIVSSVRANIEASIYEIINKINYEIESIITEKITLQRKVLADLEEKLFYTEQERQAMEQMMTADLEIIEVMLEQEGAIANV